MTMRKFSKHMPEQIVVKRAFELEKKMQKKRREASNPSLDVDSLAHNTG